jgi:hypothetical protein
MILYRYSSPSVLKEEGLNHPITLMTQFHIPVNKQRQEEIKHALSMNVANKHFDKIILLNERIYTAAELGVVDPRIEQRVVGHHLEFIDVLQNRPFGFLVFANNDIFLDDSIKKIRFTDLADGRKMYALLRYELRGTPDKSVLFGPTANSNDTFILHSNLPLSEQQTSLFNFKFGQPGCDNKLCYLFSAFGIEVVNDPLTFKSHHCHADPVRNYAHAALQPPYLCVAPFGVKCPVLGTSHTVMEPLVSMFDIHLQNSRLSHYLTEKSGNFCIPYVIGKEIANSSNSYLASLACCDLYACDEPWSPGEWNNRAELEKVHDRFQKQILGAHGFHIYNYLMNPWTHSLRGKRILIVSRFAEIMRDQPQAYDIDLFPECALTFLKPSADQPFDDFCNTVAAVDFEVALCDLDGLGNALCAHIYNGGRSAIHVGNALDLYFGIYGNRWVSQIPEIIKLHSKSFWKRGER